MTTETNPDPDALRAELAAERAAFHRERAMSLARDQIVAMAARMGIRHPERAWTALSKDPDALDLDLAGRGGARNIDAPLRELISDFPELLGRPR